VLVMGVPLQEVVRESTENAAKAIGRTELGHIGVGAEADVAVLRVDKGSFRYADGSRGTLAGDRRITCELTVRHGAVVWDWNARTGTDYRKMSKDYGIRSVDKIIRPEK